jgi:hypothetical protein
MEFTAQQIAEFDALFEESEFVQLKGVAATLGYSVQKKGDRYFGYDSNNTELWNDTDKDKVIAVVHNLAIAEANELDFSEPIDLDAFDGLFVEA